MEKDIQKRREQLYVELSRLEKEVNLDEEAARKVRFAFELAASQQRQEQVRATPVAPVPSPQEDRLSQTKIGQLMAENKTKQPAKPQVKPPVELPVEKPVSQVVPKAPLLQASSENKKPLFQQMTAKDKKELEERTRERNLSLILIAGVAMLLLAGTVLATTNWFIFSPFVKVVMILSVSLLFAGMGFIAEKVKIPKTAFSFTALAYLLLPLTFVSAAYYNLFGTYFSLTGPGRFIFGFLVSLLFTIVYYYVSQKYNAKSFLFLAMVIGFVSLLFFTRAIMPNRYLQALLLCLVLVVVNLFLDKLSFSQKWPVHYLDRYILVSHGMIFLVVLSAFQFNFLSTVELFIFAVLAIQLAVKNAKYQTVLKGASLSLLTISFIVITLISIFRIAEGWSAKLILLAMYAGFGAVFNYINGKSSLASLAGKFGEAYYLFGLGTFGLIFILNGIDRVIGVGFGAKLIGLLALSSIAILIIRLSNSHKKQLVLPLAFYLWLSQVFYLVDLSEGWGIRVRLAAVLVLYASVFFYKRVESDRLHWPLVSGVYYFFIYSQAVVYFSQYELSAWLFAAWLLLLGTSLTKVKKAGIYRMLTPIGLFFAIISLFTNDINLSLEFLLLTIILLGFGEGMRYYKLNGYQTSSICVGLISYVISLFGLVVYTGFVGVAWYHIVTLLFGSGLNLYLTIRLMKPQFLHGIPFFALLASLYPVLLFQVASIMLVVYLQVVALLFLLVAILPKLQRFTWLKKNSFLISAYALLAVAALFKVGLINGTAPVVYFIPIIMGGLKIWSSQERSTKQLYVGAESALTIMFLSSMGDYYQLEFLGMLEAMLIVSIGLIAIKLAVKGADKLVIPTGLLLAALSLLMFLLSGVTDRDAVQIELLIYSLLEFIILWHYLQSRFKALIIQPLLGWGLLHYALLLIPLVRNGAHHLYTISLLGIMLASVVYMFWAKEGIMHLNRKEKVYVNPGLGVQLLGSLIILTVTPTTLMLNSYWVVLMLVAILVEQTILFKQVYVGLESILIMTALSSLASLYQWQAIGELEIVLIVAIGLMVVRFVVKGSEKLVMPTGIVLAILNLLMILLSGLSQGAVLNVSLLIYSLIQFSFLWIYTYNDSKANLEQPLLAWGLLHFAVLLVPLLLMEARAFYTISLLTIMLVSAACVFWRQESLIMMDKPFFNPAVLVQLAGSLILYFYAESVIPLNLYWLVLVSGALYMEKQRLLVKVYQSTLSLLGLHLALYVLANYGDGLSSDTQVCLVCLSCLVVTSLNGHFIWPKKEVLYRLEWLVCSLVVFALFYRALVLGSTTTMLVAGIMTLAMVVIGFLAKLKAYFFVGLVGLITLVLYYQKEFWINLPWWAYLALGGITLLSLGVLTEVNRKKKQDNAKGSFKKKWLTKFKEWH